MRAGKSPPRQKRPQRLIHFVERTCTKQYRLVVRRVVDVVGGRFQIERAQLRLVHLRQFTSRRQQTSAVSLDLSVLAQHSKLNREPVNARETIEFARRRRSEEHTSEL